MADRNPLSDLTFRGRNSRLVRYFGRPVQQFLAVEAAGGVLMLAAAAAALAFEDPLVQDQVKIGILAGSLAAALGGLAILSIAGRTTASR